MQLNKTKLALTMGVIFLSAASSTYAASLTPTVDITTRDDVVLSQVQALDFGANIFIGTGGACKLDADAPSATVGQANGAGFSDTNFGLLSGTGCAAGVTATPGIYKVVGTAGATATVTVTPLNASTDISFVADSGCISNYEGNAGLDTCLALTNATPIPAVLADATDGADAGVTSGETIITIGGTVTIINAGGLTSSLLYQDTFDLNVVY